MSLTLLERMKAEITSSESASQSLRLMQAAICQRHADYSSGIATALSHIREYRSTGEPAYSDREEVKRLEARAEKAEADNARLREALGITPGEILHEIGGIEATPEYPAGDNLAIVIVSYFQDNPIGPEDDPVDEETGWGEWAVQHARDLEKRVAEAVCAKLRAALDHVPEAGKVGG